METSVLAALQRLCGGCESWSDEGIEDEDAFEGVHGAFELLVAEVGKF